MGWIFYVVNALFLVTLVFLAIVPKRRKWLWIWVPLFVVNLGIRVYLISAGHAKTERITTLEKKLKETRQLAVRDVYHPLSEGLRGELISALQALRSQYSNPNLKFLITPERGTGVREHIVSELARLLVDSGFKASTTGPEITNLNGNVVIILNSDDVEFGNKLSEVLTLFLNTKFVVWDAPDLPKSTLHINIVGDPLFTEDGIVTFR
ncbi:MAG: hypothetical protein ACYTEL_06865 [Planctomycetota bacterium]|jgi:energy-coupling factor transporter transmembrane protein EcfT